MGDSLDFDLRALDAEDQGRATRAVEALHAIPAGGKASAVFEALRACAPVVGGLIGVMSAEPAGSSMSHVVGLPSEVLEGWATTPREQLGQMMAPLIPAQPGELISDRAAITGAFREELDLLRVLRDAGMGESAGYKIATMRALTGRVEHRYLTIALDDGSVFGPEHRALFRLVQPAVAAALARIDVPLIAAEPIFAQILGERRTGYLCLSRALTVVELNERAHDLVVAYADAAGVLLGRGSLDRFVQRALAGTAEGRAMRLTRRDGAAMLDVTTHHLAKEVHSIGEDLTLVMLNEIEIAIDPRAGAPPRARSHKRREDRPSPPRGLTERQRDVARLLALTDGSYKQIAAELRISEGTLRKHVERVYRMYSVTSRAALTMKYR